ncbi:mechanosensitive ion channel family protein [Dysgonomonas sp. ZJ279]|uniref:mechanosensitive ion channel family protein n=1 Tax=Dysgonomonas sp. ZJ279 TaxID=2709796 RepID=UPI0013EABB9F|nr:mechanosensitive ion channel domain-containing protein [Dysgonomonas sp. ZJ279]
MSVIIPHIAIESVTSSSKFWILQYLHDALSGIGVSIKVSNIIVFTVAFISLIVIIWLLNIITSKLSSVFRRKEESNMRSKIYNVLVQKKFFNRLIVLAAIIVVFFSSGVLFSGFSESWMRFEFAISKIVVVFWVLLVLSSLLNAWELFFKIHPKTQQTSLKGYIQIIKIILGIIGAILIVSIIADKNPSNLFVGFGATAAFISLIFRDTILGFVASIQLSFQDMIRLGDWIEMPSKNADGVIVDINLSSVKVQNWDNSVTMIPIYTMVTDSFTNWRRMELGPGRLFVRSFYVSVESVKLVSDDFLAILSGNPAMANNFEAILSLARESSSRETLTNLALFRAYLELFLRKHPQINDELMLFVRYMNEITANGIGIEIYAFSRQKTASGYDVIHRSVMEYVISSAPLFDIVLFQNPSSKDLRHMRIDPNRINT